MKKLLTWPAIAIFWMTFVGVVVLGASIHQYKLRRADRIAATLFLEACEERMQALIQRESKPKAGRPLVLPIEYSPARCHCQSQVLIKNYGAETTRDVANWFGFVADHAKSRNPDKVYFSKVGISSQQRLELAYDLAARRCIF